MSRLLEALAATIEAPQSPEEWLIAKIDRAVYFARRGDDEAALSEANSIRHSANSSLPAEAVAGANLIEGVQAYFVGDQPRSLDKLRRAESLALISGRARLLHHCLAWIAHLELDRGKLAAIPPIAARILANAGETEHATLSRLASTVAVALHYANRYDLARRWYERGHRHATAIGDDLGIDAVLHNTVVFRVHNLRLGEIHGLVDRSEVNRSDQEFRSCTAYDALKRPGSYRWSLPLLAPQIQMLRGDYELARHGLASWLAQFADTAPQRHCAVAHADFAYILALQGDASGALDHVSASERESRADQALDEQAIVLFRQSQIADCAGDHESSTSLLARARATAAAHWAEQESVVAALGSI